MCPTKITHTKLDEAIGIKNTQEIQPVLMLLNIQDEHWGRDFIHNRNIDVFISFNKYYVKRTHPQLQFSV